MMSVRQACEGCDLAIAAFFEAERRGDKDAQHHEMGKYIEAVSYLKAYGLQYAIDAQQTQRTDEDAQLLNMIGR